MPDIGERPELPTSSENPEPPSVRSARHARADRAAAQHGLALLGNWRAGSIATAIVSGGLLPLAIAWHRSYAIAVAAALIGAVTLALCCHVAREQRLSTLAIFPELAALPDLARKRKRLQSARTRRTLAAGLRRTANPAQPPRRFDCCSALPDRVAGVRTELLRLATDLEQTQQPDPASVALIRELLTHATSPLYNPNRSADDLRDTLTRAHAGIRPPNPPADAPFPG
jgi:hypothetical protein